MEMRSHLQDLFRFNEGANHKLIKKIGELPQAEEAIRLMSHLIHSQDKWLARLRQEPDANQREWFAPSFALDELASEMTRSVDDWVAYLDGLSEAEVNSPIQWEGYDGAQWEADLADIALQLNFHSIHHRAQIQTMVRMQGLTPDFLDYIGTKYRRLG